ncbi:unnamed protein product [Thelazia callipaeda]|uniref:Nischarin n=1 Tax=Thelazia callipaeda TaxID=103827 RepID=A0A0N5D653_THECL|nr:unnamed protein product [Thelazia callipaeda]
MALIDLDNLALRLERNSMISIPEYKVKDGKYAVYVIKIAIDSIIWTVEKRYSDFFTFDLERFEDRKKSFLPPKKLIGNLDPEFLDERRIELEKYIRTVIELDLWLQRKRKQHALSSLVAHFLDFQEYEVHAIVEDLSLRLGSYGEDWLALAVMKPKYFEFTPIELYAITERMKLAEPTANGKSIHSCYKIFDFSGDGKVDIANYVEFLHKVQNLKVRGGRGCIGSSNIIGNTLSFSLSLCKKIKALWVSNFDVRMIHELYSVRKTCRRVIIHYSMKKISDFFLEPGEILPIENQGKWQSVDEIDFSFNEIEEVDESISLLCSVRKINLSHNFLTGIGNHLQHLTMLNELNLSNNSIKSLDSWYTRMGNVKRLYLAGNRICSLKGLQKLYSLEYLDITDNNIATADDVRPVCTLPCLDHLILKGNPVQQVIEYRTKVLELFGERFAEMRLDSRKPDQREVDTILVRLALRKAREEKEEQIRGKTL